MFKRKPYPDDINSPSRLLILPIWILAIVALGTVMNQSATIWLWVVCSFFLFVLLDPANQELKRRKWPTALASLFLILISTAIIGATVYGFGQLLADIVVELEKSKQVFLQGIQSLTSKWYTWTSGLTTMAHSTHSAADVTKVEVIKSSPIGGELSGTILHGMGSAATVLTFAILTPILSFFMLAERDSLARVFGRAYHDLTPAKSSWEKIVRSTRAFFFGNLVLGLITFPIFALIFWLFSVPSVFTVAALATFFNLIPFAGAVLSGFLPAVALYGMHPSIGAPLGVYGACVVIHFIVADFVTPKILGSQVNINATTSTIALVIWGELWGGVGLILAIPLTSLIKIMFEHSNFFWLQWIAGLMSEEVDGALHPSILGRSKTTTSSEEKL